MRYLLVDDEELARKRLRLLIEELRSDWQCTGEAGNAYEAIKLIHKTQPDVLFLDIQMPEISGFEMLDLLPEQFATPIVFVTAYDEFALKAFEANALDYLLKPVKKARLEKTIERIQHLSVGYKASELQALLGFQSSKSLKKLPVQHKQEILLLDLDSVLWIESHDTMTFVHTKDGNQYRSDRTLDDLEQRLPDFFRTHRSTIVSLSAIKKMIPWFNSAVKVELEDGTQLEVAKRRVADLKKVLMEF